MEIFSKRLRAIREERGSIFEISQHFGISDRTWGSWERDRTEPPLPTLAKIALHFGVSLDWLLGLTDSRNAAPPPTPDPADAASLDAWRERALKAEGKAEYLQHEVAEMRRERKGE